MTLYTLAITHARDDGILLIDGEPARLPGPICGISVEHPLIRDTRVVPTFIMPMERQRVEVTFRLPLGLADEFDLRQGSAWKHGYGEELGDAAKLAAIGRIHRSNEMLGTAEFGIRCVHCRFAWPCPTRRALDGDPHAVDGNTGP